MTLRRSLWPKGFTGRVIVILVLAVLVQFLAGSLLIRAGEFDIQRQDLGKRIAEQLLVAERIVEAADSEDRERLLARLSTIHTRLELIDGDPAVAPGIDPEAAEIARSIIEFEPGLADHDMRLSLRPGAFPRIEGQLHGAIEIERDVWIGFETEEPIADWILLLQTSFRIGIVSLLVLGSAALLIRTLSAPLARLSANAQLIGTSSRIHFEETEGPQELREVSRALNSMQDRLDGLMQQRTQALLAVGHDLRTPLARLQLRVDAIADPDDRRAARADIGQMTGMLQELLDFFETGEMQSVRSPIDLSSLCQTIEEAFSDLSPDDGTAIEFEGPDRLLVYAVHDHVKRAVENLVDNAIKYGGSAMIRLSADDDCATITVEDRGPGIPPDQLDRVMQPFERLDASRAGRHPGMGLGLSIAANVAKAHGGRLELKNREDGGLRASLVLERKRPPATL